MICMRMKIFMHGTIYLFIFAEYYLRCHSRKIKEAYKKTIDTVVNNQVYAVDAVKIEYLFKQGLNSSKIKVMQ